MFQDDNGQFVESGGSLTEGVLTIDDENDTITTIGAVVAPLWSAKLALRLAQLKPGYLHEISFSRDAKKAWWSIKSTKIEYSIVGE